MTISMVVGNGESRYGIDINKFSQDYTLIGCNAIHRSVAVDHLVCCDRRMVEEAVEGEFTSHTNIYVRDSWHNYFRKIRKDKRIQVLPELPYNGNIKQDQPLHWGSGPYAVLLGANISDTILMLGFDLYPKKGKVNNIYKGTKHYAKRDAKPIDPAFWIYQISKVFEHYPDKEFIIWNKSDWEIPERWRQPNVRFEEIN